MNIGRWTSMMFVSLFPRPIMCGDYKLVEIACLVMKHINKSCHMSLIYGCNDIIQNDYSIFIRIFPRQSKEYTHTKGIKVRLAVISLRLDISSSLKMTSKPQRANKFGIKEKLYF